PFDIAVRRLALDPEKGFIWLSAKSAPVMVALSIKKDEWRQKAADALAGSRAAPPPPDIVASGDQSRDAQSKYEEAGGSAEGAGFDLNTGANQAKDKPAVGGTKLTPADSAA